MVRWMQPGWAGLISAMLAALPQIAQAQDLVMPPGSTATLTRDEGFSTYPLPTGPFRNGALPSQLIEGQLRQTAWRIEGNRQTTLALLVPLREQLSEQGFDIRFECNAPECGGFDFRFATSILPEPEMHVDLGDFRFLSAERGAEAVSLMVSRSNTAAFIQVTKIAAENLAGAPAAAAPENAFAEPAPSPAGAVPASTDLEAQLSTLGTAILDGLEFASGSATLANGAYPSLDRLTLWLKDNPRLTIAVVGHTDASGGLEANITLSRQRAAAVRDYLVARGGVAAARIEAEGVGYLAPIATNLTEEGRRKNRRVEVVVTSTQVKP